VDKDLEEDSRNYFVLLLWEDFEEAKDSHKRERYSCTILLQEFFWKSSLQTVGRSSPWSAEALVLHE
jgi:hypothetical protein